MTRRRLTGDEIDLWRRVADQAQRLHPEAKTPPLPRPKPAKQPIARAKSAPPAQGTRTISAPVGCPGRTAVQMDARMFGRMKRGKLVPEARIDLHGMVLAQAHPALTRFILTAQASGKRLVLVITGKGKPGSDAGPIPVRHGVLKHQVPQWLSMPPLAQAVLQVTPAHISHGGAGAYYVYLRRNR